MARKSSAPESKTRLLRLTRTGATTLGAAIEHSIKLMTTVMRVPLDNAQIFHIAAKIRDELLATPLELPDYVDLESIDDSLITLGRLFALPLVGGPLNSIANERGSPYDIDKNNLYVARAFEKHGLNETNNSLLTGFVSSEQLRRQKEGLMKEPLRQLIARLIEHPEIADDVLRSTNEILARKKRTLWNDRKKDPRLANLTAPKFLQVVWADVKNPDGSINRKLVTDKKLLATVSGYISKQEKRALDGRKARGVGDAAELRLVKNRAGRPKRPTLG